MKQITVSKWELTALKAVVYFVSYCIAPIHISGLLSVSTMKHHDGLARSYNSQAHCMHSR